jgi:hypothetical protein
VWTMLLAGDSAIENKKPHDESKNKGSVWREGLHEYRSRVYCTIPPWNASEPEQMDYEEIHKSRLVFVIAAIQGLLFFCININIFHTPAD